jgi:hypothetical protein
MMTTMLTLTLLTLIAILIFVKRLRPSSKKPPLNDLKDANNNTTTRNHSSSLEDEPISTSALPSKNCYVTLAQHDDEQNDYLLKKSNSLTKRLSNENSNGDIKNQDASSTNIIHLSDEQNQSLNKL